MEYRDVTWKIQGWRVHYLSSCVQSHNQLTISQTIRQSLQPNE